MTPDAPPATPTTPGPADHLALRGLAERYARAADRRDGDAFAAVFTPDGHLLASRPTDPSAQRSEFEGRAELATVPGRLSRYPRTFHLVGNGTYELVGEDEAVGEVYCTAHHLVVDGDEASDHVMFIRYQDRYVRGGDGAWSIERRELEVDWTARLPADLPG